MKPAAALSGIPEVIVVGEALIDVVHTGDGVTEHPGGSPANVAYGLARLDVSTGFLTSIGTDDRGLAISSHLTGAGVHILPGSQSAAATSTATATLADDGSATYSFDLVWQLAPVAPTYLPKLLHAGSIASFLAPGAAGVKSLLQHCADLSTVTYDPNIRPELLGSHHEARTIFEDLVPLTDVVKLSDEDAAWLYPRRSPEEAARHIRGLGTDLVVVTRGSEGSFLLTADTEISVPSVESVVADTIGAGDAYMAALILGLLTRGGEGLAPPILEQIARMASMAAAITVGRPGADLPSSVEMRARLVS
ncbi:carbohydrate kinase family protein [Arthrobacter sp. U41]|uniref:carbohydrate kinase family protein n=1 Tax=Arthrobacter sp. U41 TaxID=1849032 RepID=UPI00085928BE|nr:carbohydrate kinase [Arthrobacter sp. U41]AOT05604.1 ribokinase [Arthrobacter sp. U41]